jgi:polysaccharide pyruvyl transferase WcaK-like protein/O-antigen/teichoic acid export membrane protein
MLDISGETLIDEQTLLAGGPPAASKPTGSLLYRNGIALVLNSAISSIIGVAYWLVVAHRASAAVVGQATALVAALMLLSTIAQMSLPGVLATFLPRTGPSARRLVLKAYALSIAFSIVLGAAFVLLAPRLSPAFDLLSATLPSLLFPLAVATWSIFALQDNALTGLRRAVWVPIENTLYSATKLGAVLLLGTGVGAFAYLSAWVAPAALALVPISALLFARLLPAHARLREHEDMHGLRRYFAGDSTGLVLGQISTTLLPVLVITRLGAEANASFGIAWLIVASLDLIAINLGMSLTVEGAHDEARLPMLLQSVRNRTVLLIVVLAGVGIAIAPQLLSIFGASYAEHGVTVFRLLLLGSIGRAVTTLEICAARAQRRPKRIVAIQGTLALLIPTSVWLLAKPAGLTGVGIAYAVSQLMVAGAIVILKPTRRPQPVVHAHNTPGWPATVLCVNHWHDDNKGDSAITGAIVALVQRNWPHARIRVATLNEVASADAQLQLRHLLADAAIEEESSFTPTESASRRTPFPGRFATALRWLARLAPFGLEVLSGAPRRSTRRRLESADLLVTIGGSSIYDDPDVAAPLSLARLLCILYPIWAAGRVGTPVVLAGHTLGPFPRRSGRLLARWMLRRVDITVLREQTSLEVAQRLRLKSVRVRPDLAFATAAQRTERVTSALARLPEGTDAPLALVIRQHPHAGSQADLRVAGVFAQVAREAVADGLINSVLVVVQCMGPTAIEDDRALSEQLCWMLEEDVPTTLVAEDLTVGELAALYGACRVVLTVRLHAAILALSQATPAYSVAYMTRKTEGVMQAAGRGGDWCAFDDLNSAQVSFALKDMLAPRIVADLQRRAEDRLIELHGEAASWLSLEPVP